MHRADHQPETLDVAVFGGIFCKTWYVRDAMTMLPQHAHTYPHLTLVLRGSVRAWRGESLLGDFIAPATIRVAADTLHQFLTLDRDVVLACIHNADRMDADEEEPRVSQENRLELEG